MDTLLGETGDFGGVLTLGLLGKEVLLEGGMFRSALAFPCHEEGPSKSTLCFVIWAVLLSQVNLLADAPKEFRLKTGFLDAGDGGGKVRAEFWALISHFRLAFFALAIAPSSSLGASS